MKTPILPTNELERLKALDKFDILDTIAEQSFDDLSFLAAKICETPIALISFMDEKRHWFKSHYGIAKNEVPRDYSFFPHLEYIDNIFEVTDTNTDEKFASNIIDTNFPKIRFIAATPLQNSDGYILGTLCVIDKVPNKLNTEQHSALKSIARQIVAQLELRIKQKEIQNTQNDMHAMRKSFSIIEFDPNGVILNANDNSLKLYGYKIDEIIGKHHGIFIPYAERISENYKKFWLDLKNGIFQSNEFKRITNNDTEIWIKGIYNPIFSHDNKVLKIIKIFLDITEEKNKSNDALQKLQSLSKSNSIIEFDLEGNIISVNENYMQLMEYSGEELIGKHHSIFVPEKIKNTPAYRDFWLKLRDGHHQIGEFERVSKTGKIIYIRGTYNPIFDINGTLIKIVKHALDVTNEKIINTNNYEILKAIDRFSSFIEFNLDGTILSANENFLKMMKYYRSEIIGKHHSIFLKEEEIHSTFYVEFWENIRKGKIQTGEFLRINKYGKEIWIRGVYNPIFNLNGEPYKVIKYLSDITSEKIAKDLDKQRRDELIEKEKNLSNANEQLLKAKEKAIRADQIKTNFLYTMSHEIRTPLNGIIGMSSLLQETQLTPEQKEFSETISQSSKTLCALINDILDLSKIESGKMEIEEIEFNFCSFFKDIIKPFYFSAQKKNIFFKTECNDYGFKVYGDFPRLGQIISNLISNAIKFTAEGGVEVTANLSPQNDMTLLNITIHDTGIGIPEDAKNNLFQSFTQAEKSTSRNFGGTGLGLSISKQLIELMKGSISFESTYAEGTTFKIELLLKTGSQIQPNLTLNQTLSEKDQFAFEGRVLIAEDNETNQLVLARMLEKWGCKYQIVDNGTKVLVAMKENQFDLILMDCQMPETDGYTASKLIRKSNILNNQIPIIAFTANIVQGEAEKCLSAGMNEYLTKPVDKKSLELILKKYLICKNG
ncbi:PAS domain S-box protein [Fluviispira vulneris]|uniref:PAS domain S-box protein n=1 Tax=Fluviispira vulneris TaxID=2763012 RepID=UPI00164979B1|nr:PAS domain S-box protein [Fluviispira vulneris]